MQDEIKTDRQTASILSKNVVKIKDMRMPLTNKRN
jgi:hypothetical protein